MTTKSIYLKVEYDTPEQLAKLDNYALLGIDVDLWVCEVENGKIITDDKHHISNDGNIEKNRGGA